jgi:disulfide bond formation protein DsbB
MRIFYGRCMQSLFSSHRMNICGSIISATLLGIGFYVEYTQNLHPCVLCIMQRIVWFILGVVLLGASVQNPARRGTQIYGWLTLLFASIGIFWAGRQIWLESIPHLSTNLCLPGFSYLISHFPLKTNLSMLFRGSESCGEVEWIFWGWSIARWSCVWFVLFAALGIGQIGWGKKG